LSESYANQQYKIDEGLLGTRWKFKTRLAVKFVVKVFDSGGKRIDISALGERYQDSDDCLDALYNRKMVTLNMHPKS